MEIEDDRLVCREQGIEIAIRQSVRMFRARLQFEQVDDVDETNLQVGEIFPQQRCRGQRLLRWDVAGRSAITTSGSPPWSLLAQSQMPSPLVQCSIAASMFRY